MSTAAAFRQTAAELLALLGVVDARLGVMSNSALPTNASAVSFRTAVAALRAPAAQQALAEDGEQWLKFAETARLRLAVVVNAAGGSAEGLILARALRDCERLLERLDRLLAPPGPPAMLLAGGAAAAFALAWFLFRERERAQVSLELDEPEEAEPHETGPAVEYLPPEPPGGDESYEPDEIEDAEFEPA